MELKLVETTSEVMIAIISNFSTQINYGSIALHCYFGIHTMQAWHIFILACECTLQSSLLSASIDRDYYLCCK